jgi:hypothetical protein
MSDMTTQAGYYVIRVQGHLAPRWADWFAGLTIAHTARGETILSGPIEDQAALHGALAKVRDLNLILIAVNRIEKPDTSASRDSSVPFDNSCAL